MPIVNSPYIAFGPFKNAHFSTIYSAKIRRVTGVLQDRVRLELPDGDFVDIDWSYACSSLSRKRAPQIALLIHGLEGDAQRPYMLGMAKLLVKHGYDVAALNFRGCSGTQNLKYRSYHSGDTGDIRYVVNHLSGLGYKSIYLYGVSLGGNALLKYLGENNAIPNEVKVASCIGVPIDLKASLEQLEKKENIVYRTSFLVHLRAKYRMKMKRFPQLMTRKDYHKINSLKTFDDLYTAPAHGFENALDYYTEASSYQYLSMIKIPTLILNAKNDSFLHGDCYPTQQATTNKHLFLEMPSHGGHVGFYKSGGFYYNEVRSLDFFKKHSL